MRKLNMQKIAESLKTKHGLHPRIKDTREFLRKHGVKEPLDKRNMSFLLAPWGIEPHDTSDRIAQIAIRTFPSHTPQQLAELLASHGRKVSEQRVLHLRNQMVEEGALTLQENLERLSKQNDPIESAFSERALADLKLFNNAHGFPILNEAFRRATYEFVHAKKPLVKKALPPGAKLSPQVIRELHGLLEKHAEEVVKQHVKNLRFILKD